MQENQFTSFYNVDSQYYETVNVVDLFGGVYSKAQFLYMCKNVHALMGQ